MNRFACSLLPFVPSVAHFASQPAGLPVVKVVYQ